MVSLTNPVRVAITGLSLILCMFATFYFLVVLKTGLLYVHLFYFPVVVVSGWWHRKGIILTFSLVLFLLTCNVYFAPDISVTHNLERATILLFVSILTSTMFERRRRTEEELRKSEKNWSNSFSSLKDVMIIINKDYTVEKINSKGLKLLGKTREEVIGKKCYHVICGMDAPSEFCPFKRTLKTGKVESVDTYMELFDKHFDIKSSPILNERGEIVKFVDLMRDTTQRKKIEQTLKESEEKYRNLVENASDGIVYIDLAGRILDVNKKAEEIVAMGRDEIIGKNYLELGIFPLEYVEKVMHGFERAVEEGRATELFGFEIVDRKGERKFIAAGNTLIKENGEAVGFLSLIRDVTERKKMEKKLKEYTAHLEEKVEERTKELKETHERLVRSERLAAIGEAAAMVGHDLRNPLQSIETAAYYLNNELPRIAPSIPVPQKAKEMFQVIKDSVDYADKIIIDLHDFAATKKPILKKTDVNAIVKETLSQVEAPENVEIVTELGHLPRIEADKDMIRRVFMNLALNGIQAMENEGRLKVSTKKTKGSVEVSFKDTGIGIPKENMEKIFSPFFTTKARGMGMGLAICEKFVEIHGGNIEVESKEGKGSTFTVKLPLNKRVEVKKLDEG